MRAALLLLPALLMAGCSSPILPGETGPRTVEGATDGYQPTQTFLKVFVKTEDGKTTLVDFDRRDWYVSRIVDQLEGRELKFVAIHGQERQTMGEVVVEEALTPDSLNDLRYDRMHATAEDRSLMDAEYDRVLERLVPTSPSAPSVPSIVV